MIEKKIFNQLHPKQTSWIKPFRDGPQSNSHLASRSFSLMCDWDSHIIKINQRNFGVYSVDVTHRTRKQSVTSRKVSIFLAEKSVVSVPGYSLPVLCTLLNGSSELIREREKSLRR